MVYMVNTPISLILLLFGLLGLGQTLPFFPTPSVLTIIKKSYQLTLKRVQRYLYQMFLVRKVNDHVPYLIVTMDFPP